MVRRAPKPVVDLLASVTLFSGCSRRELGQLARLGTAVPAAKGATLTTQGEAGSEFMLIFAGRARCLVDGIKVGELGPGDSFGELALLGGGRRVATVIADTDMDLLVLNRHEFSQLLDRAPSIRKNLLTSMASYQRTAAPSVRQ